MERLDEAFNWCRLFTRSKNENFSVVSFLLPKEVRPAFFAIYAYCRVSDDIADESRNSETALTRLDDWETALQKSWERSKKGRGGESNDEGETHPIFIALEELFRRYPKLTVEPFSDLLIAFRLDQIKKSYDTYAELLDYCRFSANPVGRMLLAVMKPDAGEDDFRLSDSVCTGLQLANFWQDVRRDGEMGRNYIPEEFLDRYSSFREMMRDLCDDAAMRLEAGRPLIRRLRHAFRLDVRLFIDGGLAILREIKKIDYRVEEIRPTVPKAVKFLLLVKALIY